MNEGREGRTFLSTVMNIMFPRVIDNLTVISGLKNSSSDAIRRVIGSEREMFDRIDPETLQIIKHDLDSQKSSIYSSSSVNNGIGRNNIGKEFNSEIINHSSTTSINQWKRNSALNDEIKKQDSFNQRISEIANDNGVVLERNIKGKGLLDDFLVDPNEENVLTTRRAKSTLNFTTNSAENIFDLYARALPELRAELRQKGLKQVGFIKFNNDKAVEKLKLSSKENFKHNAFNPLAFEDPSMRVLAPKQWKGSLPSPAKDDIIQSAINGLKTHFELNSNFLVQGDPISYDFVVSQENTESQALESLTIQLVITLTHVDTSRTLSQTKKTFKFNQDSPFEIVKPLQTLNLNTKYMDLGTYQLFAQVFLFLPNSALSSILSSHGPFDIFLTR